MGTCFDSRCQFNQTRIFITNVETLWLQRATLAMVGLLVGVTVFDWLVVVLYLSSSMLSLRLLPFIVLLHPTFNLVFFVSLFLCCILALLIFSVVFVFFLIFYSPPSFSAVTDSNVTTSGELKYFFFCRFNKIHSTRLVFRMKWESQSFFSYCSLTGGSLEKCQPLTFTRF